MDLANIFPLTPTVAGLEPKHVWASVVRFWLRIKVSESKFNWICELEFERNYNDWDCNWTSCIYENIVFFWVYLLHERATQEHIYDSSTKETVSQIDTWANPLPWDFTPSLNFTLSRESPPFHPLPFLCPYIPTIWLREGTSTRKWDLGLIAFKDHPGDECLGSSFICCSLHTEF